MKIPRQKRYNLCRGKRQDAQTAKEVAKMANNDPTTTGRTDTRPVRMRSGTFRLRGVHCLGCAGAVERALRE